MNKNIIALAVAAGFAAPMAANAAPTLYGALQMELASHEVLVGGLTTLDAMQSDDNKRGRLGIKGSEDLGNGLKAIYKFEWQVDASDADLYDGSRESFVGLKGDWGTFEAGQLKSAYKYAGGVKYDPFVTTFLEARSRGGMSGKWVDGTNFAVPGTSKGAFGHHGFLSDNIAYSNKFDKVAVRITTSLDETGGAKGSDGDMTASIKYKGKSFEIFGAMAHDEDYLVVGNDYDATKIGGQWKSGAHKLSAQIENTEAGAVESDVYFVGYQFKMGKNTFVAQMGNTDITTFGLERDYTALGVIHKFSKKTRIFAGISNSDDNAGNEDNATSVGLRVDF